MAGVPINFALPNENIISTYSWSDIIDGNGFIDFYFGTIGTSSGTQYFLKPSSFIPRTDVLYTKFQTASTSYVQAMDLTFTSSVFNTKRILNGTALINLAIIAYNQSCYFVINILKNGSQVATATSYTLTSGGANQYISVPISLDNIIYSNGDTFGINVVGYIKKDAGSAADLVLVYHPLNLAVSAGTLGSGGSSSVSAGFSLTKIAVPVKIET